MIKIGFLLVILHLAAVQVKSKKKNRYEKLVTVSRVVRRCVHGLVVHLRLL